MSSVPQFRNFLRAPRSYGTGTSGVCNQGYVPALRLDRHKKHPRTHTARKEIHEDGAHKRRVDRDGASTPRLEPLPRLGRGTRRFVDECGAYLTRARRAVTVKQVAERGAYHSAARVADKHLQHLELLLRIEFREASSQKLYLIADRERAEESLRASKAAYWDAKRANWRRREGAGSDPSRV
jgi:hypothetical protein